MREIPIDERLSRELEDVLVFGPEDAGVLNDAGFVARVADQPIGVRLRDYFERYKISSELTLFDRFDVWLIPHRVSVIRREGLAEHTSVGLEVEYDAGGGTCSIASLIPAFEYVVLGSV